MWLRTKIQKIIWDRWQKDSNSIFWIGGNVVIAWRKKITEKGVLIWILKG